MSEFQLYLGMGFEHIIDINGYDHILFVVALTAAYQIKDINSIFKMITGFTISHSLTLALAVFNLIPTNRNFVEFLIPLTIFITCITNILQKNKDNPSKAMFINMIYASVFGLIHGLGFSNYLKSFLMGEESILIPLLAFNLGLEIGQLLIVMVFLVACFIFVILIEIEHHKWKFALSAFAGLIAIKMMILDPFL